MVDTGGRLEREDLRNIGTIDPGGRLEIADISQISILSPSSLKPRDARLLQANMIVGSGESERDDRVVHSLLLEPEKVYPVDLGERRVVNVVRNNTILSPNGLYLGGVRWVSYPDNNAAISDGEKLGRGMTHKWATLNEMLMTMALRPGSRVTMDEVNATLMGGGKAVIYDPNYDRAKLTNPSTELNDLEKRILDGVIPFLKSHEKYIFAPDSGTDNRHVDYVAQFVPNNAACLSEKLGGSGDPSIVTARGVYESMLEAVRYRLNVDSLNGLTIAIKGLGKVGSHLIDYIIAENPHVKLVITDIDIKQINIIAGKLEEKGIEFGYVPPDEIHAQQYNVFSPNALGQEFKPETVRTMVGANPNKGLIIVGGANNQIDDRVDGRKEEVESLFREHSVLYAPDFVVNLGGILNLIYEFPRVNHNFGGVYNRSVPLERVRGVRILLDRIFKLSDERGVSTQSLAERIAEEHIRRVALYRGLSRGDLTNRKYVVH